MNVPCIQDSVALAMAHNEGARRAVRDVIRMLPEDDYRCGVLLYALSVLSDCRDDYKRILKALERCE